MPNSRPIRVLLAKPGLDGHDLGVKMVALALKDAGMEVIYMGMRQTPEGIVKACIQEDADILGLSNLSASLIPMGKRVIDLIKEKKMDVPVIYGGTILNEDKTKLLDMGITATFSPGTMMKDIIQTIRELVPKEKLQ